MPERLNRLIDKGLCFTVATARTYATVNSIVKDVHLTYPMILMNGVMIYDLLRGVLFGMPAIFPNAFCMAFELATYGLVAGILSEKMKKDIKSLYISLIAAMLCGRIVWGLVSAAVYAFTGGIFTWELFLMGGFINALPGILIQLVLIPSLVERLYNMEGTVEWN